MASKAARTEIDEIEEHLNSMSERLSCLTTKEDLDENQKRWLVVGVCLHSIISPLMRSCVEPEIQKMYTAAVTAHQIDTQAYPNIIEKYPSPNGYRLNYQSIKNNTVHGRNIRNFDFTVTNHIDFSKLFLQPHMAKYTGFDETCDASALLGLIMNMEILQPAVRVVIEKIRNEVRNDWAHCDFRQWDEVKSNRAFKLFDQMITQLQLQPQEETEILDKLTKWETEGQHMLGGSEALFSVLNETRNETALLARYMLNLKTTVMATVPPNIIEQHLRIIENWTGRKFYRDGSISPRVLPVSAIQFHYHYW